ncbi:hypothetical protein GW756_04530 [bacterium]|nr:hypothetical protein [bacterium]NCQ55133.1 hypothetical protein [Candidatus Parcubacteria bacterium]NCS67354.1 hypothetical protein [Candidatus Peregrinibacteria bacterium]NCS96609.1 hypothetical protein [bacterium]
MKTIVLPGTLVLSMALMACSNTVMMEEEDSSTPPNTNQAATFTAPLEEVNTGCFADGECYIMAGGKHVTAIMGWSQETVGKVMGVEGFGDLSSHIGEDVKVYAAKTQDTDFYTLYGSEDYYIQLLEAPDMDIDANEDEA